MFNIKEDCYCFQPSPESVEKFCCYFLYCVHSVFLFPKSKLSVIYFFSFSRYQISILFVILSNILQSMCVKVTGLQLLTSFGSFPCFSRGVIIACFQVFCISSSSQVLLYMSSRYFSVFSSSRDLQYLFQVLYSFVILGLFSVPYLQLIYYMVGLLLSVFPWITLIMGAF